ncbi:hypothetical protein [Paraburkholderia caribensis]|uniref:hypothetical protein n=1 Tax=Paraburkholderia caribensis TaxID=75105 RepID=UPI000ABAE3CF|nr:hypothetical protein [Paraburkholderia caribensis]
MNKPRLVSLTFIGFYLVAALDHDEGDKFTFDDVYSGIENGTLLADLKEKLPDSFDFSLFPPGGAEELAIIEALRPVAGGLEGRERRKTGVENSGLSLLIAFIFELIQQENWVK